MGLPRREPILAPTTQVKGRPQPPRHPRMEAYQSTSLQQLSAYCYTCDSRVMGAEVLLHLFFGELGCKYCDHSIYNCAIFRKDYPMKGLCRGTRGAHNPCRWVVAPCNYLMYHTRMHLAMIKGTSKLDKKDVFRAATIYLRGVLPLRRMYPWRAALKTVSKAGIGVDLSNLPPRLKRCRNTEGDAEGRAGAMLGVSGILQVEKSIARLEKMKNTSISPEKKNNASMSPEKKNNTSISSQQPPQEIENCDIDSQANDDPVTTHNNTSISSKLPPEETRHSDIDSQVSNPPANTHSMPSEDTCDRLQNNTAISLKKKNKTSISSESQNNTFISLQQSPQGLESCDIDSKVKDSPDSTHSMPSEDTCDRLQNNTAISLKKKNKTSISSESQNNTFISLQQSPQGLESCDIDSKVKDSPDSTHSMPSEDMSVPENTHIKTRKKAKKRKLDTFDTIENTDGNFTDIHNAPVTTHNTPSEDMSVPENTHIKTHKKRKKRKLDTFGSIEDIDGTFLNTHNTAPSGDINDRLGNTITKACKKTKKTEFDTLGIGSVEDTDGTFLNTHNTAPSGDINARLGNTITKTRKKTKFDTLGIDNVGDTDGTFLNTHNTAPSGDINTRLGNTITKTRKKTKFDTLGIDNVGDTDGTFTDTHTASSEDISVMYEHILTKGRKSATYSSTQDTSTDIENTPLKKKKKKKKKNTYTHSNTQDTSAYLKNSGIENRPLKNKKNKRKNIYTNTSAVLENSGIENTPLKKNKMKNIYTYTSAVLENSEIENSPLKKNKMKNTYIYSYAVLENSEVENTSLKNKKLKNTDTNTSTVLENSELENRPLKNKLKNTNSHTNSYSPGNFTLSEPQQSNDIDTNPASVESIQALITPASLEITPVNPAKTHKKGKKITLPEPHKENDMNIYSASVQNILSEAHITPVSLEITPVNPASGENIPYERLATPVYPVKPVKRGKKNKLKYSGANRNNKLKNSGTNALVNPADTLNTPVNTHNPLSRPWMTKISTKTLLTIIHSPIAGVNIFPGKEYKSDMRFNDISPVSMKITPAKKTPRKKNRTKLKTTSPVTSTPASEESYPARTLTMPSRLPVTPLNANYTLPKHQKKRKGKVTPASIPYTPAWLENILRIEADPATTPVKPHKKKKRTIPANIASSNAPCNPGDMKNTPVNIEYAPRKWLEGLENTLRIDANPAFTPVKPHKKKKLTTPANRASPNTPCNPGDISSSNPLLTDPADTSITLRKPRKKKQGITGTKNCHTLSDQMTKLTYNPANTLVTPAKVLKGRKKARLSNTPCQYREHVS